MATGSCQGNASGGWLRRSCPAPTQLLPGWPSQGKTPHFQCLYGCQAHTVLLPDLDSCEHCCIMQIVGMVLAAWKAIACVSDTTAKPSGESSSAAACRVDIVKDTEAHFPPRLKKGTEKMRRRILTNISLEMKIRWMRKIPFFFPYNYRQITLLSLPRKACARVPERGVHPLVEPQIEEQVMEC